MMKLWTILIAILLFISGCGTLSHTRSNITYEKNGTKVTSTTEHGFWEQRIITTAIGLFWFSMYGPVGLGYLQWQRNIDEPKDPDKLSDVLENNLPIPGAAIP